MSRISRASHQLIQHGAIANIKITHQPLAPRSPEFEDIGLTVSDEVVAPLLIDTGASHTVIEQRIVEQIGLDPVGTVNLFGFGMSKIECLLYRARLLIDTKIGLIRLDTAIASMPILLATELPFRGLLGRSSLQKVKFLYDGIEGAFDIKC